MRRLGLVAILLAITADAGRFDRLSTRCQSGRSDRGLPCGDDFAFFEFAPDNGAGMGAACACTTPTGAKGEALTFTRTGDATCSRQGLATTGIQNGDLVVCTANQPRVESSGGLLGLRVEGARTNSIPRSAELSNAVWVPLGAGGPAAPTVTANFDVAPDGTTTAERVQVNACAGASTASVVYQDYTGTAAAWSGSFFVRGNGTSGSFSVYYFDATAVAGSAVQCSFVSTSWTRCVVPRTFANTTHRLGIGCINDAVIAGSTNTGAADILVWGAQSEAGAYATSYIPTVASAVTRNAETATLPVALSTGSSFSFAQSYQSPSTVATCAGFFAVNTASAGPVIYSCFTSSNVFRVTDGVSNADSTSTTFSAFKWQTGIRWGGSWNRSTSVSTAFTDGVQGTPSSSVPGLGSLSWSSMQLLGDGVHSRICADPDPSRCR